MQEGQKYTFFEKKNWNILSDIIHNCIILANVASLVIKWINVSKFDQTS